MIKGTRYTPVEDATLREYAGKKTAEEIGVIIGRPTSSVHSRMHLLRIPGRLLGENHRGSKLSKLQAQMLTALYQAGFTSNEIQKAAFSHVTVTTILNVANGVTHRSEIS
jgi:hypothetical protein